MRFERIVLSALVTLLASVQAFAPSATLISRQANVPFNASPRLFDASTVLASEGSRPSLSTSKEDQLRAEGGWLSFNTKYGALNPFAIYYGTIAVLLGIPWFLALSLYQCFRFVTRGKIDKQRLIPVLINQMWGTTLMILTRSVPKIENREVLQKFFEEGRPAMFVANHSSWMDIPFMGHTIGWRNYKIIAKAELSKVPILGKAIVVGGNVRVDRTNKRSQLQTLKTGIQYLKDRVNLCTFPEGTRSRDGKVKKFKNGAFKMAHKAGAPVIPLSIVGGHKVNPSHWMFINKPARNICKVVVNEPIESKGITEQELADQVRKSIIDGLPADQHP